MKCFVVINSHIDYNVDVQVFDTIDKAIDYIFNIELHRWGRETITYYDVKSSIKEKHFFEDWHVYPRQINEVI